MKEINKILLFNLIILITICISCQPKPKFIETKVDIGTHTLNFNLFKGNGIPIVFESGSSDIGTVWSPLANSLHSQLETTILTYDRAGYGTSELNPNLTDSEKGNVLNTVKDLEHALKVLNINEQIIYVAHSYGGFIATVFAERNPDLIIGIVLIDANLKCFWTDEIRTMYKEMATDSLFNSMKEQFGVGWYHEQRAAEESIEIFLNSSFPSKIPIIDLVAENSSLPFESTVDKWMSCHKEFGSSNPNWTSYIAKDCGHYVFRDNPEIVNQKIIELYNQVDIKK